MRGSTGPPVGARPGHLRSPDPGAPPAFTAAVSLVSVAVAVTLAVLSVTVGDFQPERVAAGMTALHLTLVGVGTTAGAGFGLSVLVVNSRPHTRAVALTGGSFLVGAGGGLAALFNPQLPLSCDCGHMVGFALLAAAVTLPGASALAGRVLRRTGWSLLGPAGAAALGALTFAGPGAPEVVAYAVLAVAAAGTVVFAVQVLSDPTPLGTWLTLALAVTTGVASGAFLGVTVLTAATTALLLPAAGTIASAGAAFRALAEAADFHAGRNATLRRVAHTIAHDLNQPIAASHTALATAARQAPDELDLPLELLQRALDDLKERTDEINEYSSVTGSQMQRSKVDLAAVCTDVAALYTHTGTATVQGDGTVVGDERLLRRMVINLLGNAFQHGAAHVTVTVTARTTRHGAQTELTVEDDGPGIPAALATELFEPFVRDGTAAGGTGLGLAICATVAELHQGSIRHESPAGGGARFVATFPTTP